MKTISKLTQKKKYKNYFYSHKKAIIRAFYEALQCKDLEWFIQDPQVLKALWLRVLEHDDDKWDDKEKRKIYQNYLCPINREQRKEYRSQYKDLERQHQEEVNHHWQARCLDTDFTLETELACFEEILDWIAHNKRPYQVWDAQQKIIAIPKIQKDFMEKCIYQGIDKKYILLNEGKTNGWDQF